MKKSFKDFLEQDITNVFVNANEFAEKAIIEGIEMDIVLDTVAVLQGDKKNQVAACDVVFHVSSSYFEEIPQAEKMMSFNDKDYFIETVHENMGMLTIGLSRNQS